MNKWFAKGKKAAASGNYQDMYDAWSRATGKPTKVGKGTFGDIVSGKYVEAQENFYEGFIYGERGRNPRAKKSNNPSTFIPLRGIRRTSDGGIQILAPHGTLSNPAKKRGFLKKVERLFSAGTRTVKRIGRKALGNKGKVKVYEVVHKHGTVVKVTKSKDGAEKFLKSLRPSFDYFIREGSYFA